MFERYLTEEFKTWYWNMSSTLPRLRFKHNSYMNAQNVASAGIEEFFSNPKISETISANSSNLPFTMIITDSVAKSKDVLDVKFCGA
ncbi:hypothetical protein HNY73_009979 [Argiope bruennichi]|uniref:Uncharacterized protein n=1 Tax=Argiope bruennichi TaxID=94029 RepID=A0A8T0EZI5_ARGBR|nr:hypothetical protein HNY73_009979 [Argiope bruennichi]